MFLSNPAISFLAGIFVLVSTAGCGFLQSDENTAAPVADGPKSRIPFKTKEPEAFQCEIVETAGEAVRRKQLAKKGIWRRIDFDLGEKHHRAVLETDKTYLIDFGRGVYAEKPATADAESRFSELTHELLNIGRLAEFDESGREGNIVRYLVRPADGDASEFVVHYDEAIGMPVKQEFFSLQNGERTLQSTVELINFRNEPDATLFSIPAGFQKVSMTELLKNS